MATHQAPPSLGFSTQEYWSGCHLLLQCMKVKSESEVTQSCLTLSDPMDCSLPGSSIHGIFQARVLEWGAIALEGINSRISEAEEQISELKDKMVKITSEEQNKVKRMKTTEDSLRGLWDNVKCTNIQIIGVPE